MAEEYRSERIKTIIIISLIMVILAGAVVIWMLWPRPETDGVSVDPNAILQEEERPDVVIPGYVSIVIPANATKAGSVDFYNPDENADNYYLTFRLELADTGEVIYESGLIEPRKHVRQIELSRKFEPGRYDALIHVQPYIMDDEREPVNNAELKTKLIVK